MRRCILAIMALVALSASAEEVKKNAVDSLSNNTRVISMPNTEWLSPYNKVVIEGPVNVTFKRVENNEGLKIVYDQRGGNISRFRAGVDKNGVLTISERMDIQHNGPITDVTLWYSTLEDITVVRSTVVFEDEVESRLLDLKVRSGATVTLDIDVMDALVECSGKSRLQIGGQARYFSLTISTAKMDGFDLQTVAANVDASHEAEVRISVSERLEAMTSTSAKLLYKGTPTILRNKNSLFGGEITAVK